MTLSEFGEKVLPNLGGKIEDVIRKLEPLGISRHDVGCLRKVFGISHNTIIRKIFPQDIKDMEAMVEAGMTHREIGKKYGVAQTRVSYLLKRAGVDSGRFWTKRQTLMLIDCCKKNMPWKDIAMKMQMTEHKVKGKAAALKIGNGRAPGFMAGNKLWKKKKNLKCLQTKEN